MGKHLLEKTHSGIGLTVLAGLLAFCLITPCVFSQDVEKTSSATSQPAPTSTAVTPATKPVTAASHRYEPSRFPKRAKMYYQMDWGIDSLVVRSVESGELIRFNYRVIDAAKAVPLNDKKSEPFLVDERARVKLVIPSLEKVGQLRQSSTPEAGKVYWMAFSNKGGLVKRGDRVSVVIGNFRADGLVVE
jgi:hypothetical protein